MRAVAVFPAEKAMRMVDHYLVIGHESLGRVIETGGAVTRVKAATGMKTVVNFAEPG